MKQFTSVKDVADINALVSEALQHKSHPHKWSSLGKDIKLGLIFFNPSLRTRVSTQIAAKNLGIESFVINAGSDSWQIEWEDGVIMNSDKVEHIKDAAGVLGSYFDVIGVRTFPTLTDREKDYSEFYLHQLIKYSKKPVISLESTTLHPLQSLADIITINENTSSLNRKVKVVLTWAPHIKALPQCVSNSFAQWVNAWGESEFVITHPKGYELDKQYTKGAKIEYDQNKALKNADFVYVKNWSSYNDYGKILDVKENWLLNLDKLKVTNNAKVMHCLPVRRNLELGDDILDSEHSVLQQQAINRIYAAQAVLADIISNL
jgi:N-succinyl-L-ornithine transcarbamylase